MISWLLVLILFPGVGLVAYLAFGRSFRKKYRVRGKKIIKKSEDEAFIMAKRKAIENLPLFVKV